MNETSEKLECLKYTLKTDSKNMATSCKVVKLKLR